MKEIKDGLDVDDVMVEGDEVDNVKDNKEKTVRSFEDAKFIFI